MAVVAGSHPYDPGDCLNRHCIFSPIGDTPFDLEKVRLGDWLRGEHYLYNILEDLNHWVVGWTDWNLALDMMASFASFYIILTILSLRGEIELKCRVFRGK